MSRPALERAAETAFMVAGLLALAGVVMHHMSILGDGFWSVATGRWLLAHHALPYVDPFSYASVGSRWTVDSCGRGVLFALVTNIAGARGLMLACEVDLPAPAVARRALLEERLIVNATGPTTLRLLPPLTISRDHAEEALLRLAAALAATAAA